MINGKLKIATCQFAVSNSITENASAIIDFMQQAKKASADIVHFSECALSGYAGVDFDNLENYNWSLLQSETEKVMETAAKLKLWTILGSTHRLTEPNKPHNCLYLIDTDGKIAARYDKRFCTECDLIHYTPGDRFVTFEINNIKCALLICFDLRFPEIYRALKKLNVQCIFQSFYNARQSGPSVHSHIMQQTMQCRAGTNYFRVSMANSSGRIAPYASCFIQPDGVIADKLKLNTPGIMINTVDTNAEFYDPSKRFRNAAINGALTNGPGQINDPRSKNTTCL